MNYSSDGNVANGNVRDPEEAAAPRRLPRFLAFLVNVAESVAERAEEDGVGTVKHEVVQLRERTESSNGLACVRITHVGDEGEEAAFRMFAAGAYRDKNLIKLEREDDEEQEFVYVSSNPNLVLAYISF
ncbi:MAG: hypothetical protein R3236_03405 [Phycisphaeraceae bacterium]|nr:hypothetical protein [Phycisphaeraceae bacterium]